MKSNVQDRKDRG